MLAVPAAADMQKKVPIDAWALRTVVNGVSVSPDGKHVLVMKVESKEGKYLIEIYDTSDFSKPVRRINAKPMEFFTAPQWVSDNVFVGNSWKWNRKSVRGPEDSAFDTLLYSYNIETNKFRKLENKKTRYEGAGFSVIHPLPKDPENIIIATGTEVGDTREVDPLAIIRPRSYYKFNVNKGSKILLLKGNEKYSNVQFDGNGNPRFAQGYLADSNEFVTYYRLPGDSSWKETGERLDGNNHDHLYKFLGGFEGPVGWKKDEPGTAYMLSARDGDKVALWEYDLAARQYGKKIFEAPDADIIGMQSHSNAWGTEESQSNLVGAIYPGAKYHRKWFNMEEKALHEQFESKIPHAHQVSITSRSRDGQTMVVQNRGPKDPGSFWFVQNGKMAKLGSRNPLLKPEDLSEVKYIRYTARDGLTIPAFVTIPKGDGPHPLVVLPHGGPHVTEVISYDEWGQFLANNGYMVLQPQYRISTGWGKKHFDLGYGEHGLAMQDDKDDGALYLVKQGMVDPNRIAMFGWSYGGYAALVAASREPNVYQCVIAGAAVADAKKVYLKRKGRASNKALDDWSRRRGGFVGINPIDEMDKVNVPVMMVHGDLDARVLYFNYKDYRKEMERVSQSRQTGTCTGGIEDSVCTTTLYRTNSKGQEDSVVPMATRTPTEVAMEAVEPGMQKSSNRKTSSYTAKNRFITLKGADHFSITLMYDHQKEFYTEMLDFLQNDCGPGGL